MASGVPSLEPQEADNKDFGQAGSTPSPYPNDMWGTYLETDSQATVENCMKETQALKVQGDVSFYVSSNACSPDLTPYPAQSTNPGLLVFSLFFRLGYSATL